MKKKVPVVAVNVLNPEEKVYKESTWECCRWLHANNENSNLITIKRDVSKALKGDILSVYGYYIFYKGKEPKDIRDKHKKVFERFIENREKITLKNILSFHNRVFRKGSNRHIPYDIAYKIITMYMSLMVREISESIAIRRVLSPYDLIDLLITKRKHLFATIGNKKKFSQRIMIVNMATVYIKRVKNLLRKK